MRAVLPFAVLLPLTPLLACDVSAPDEARLSTLSRDERIDLCDELEDALASSETEVICSETSLAYTQPPFDVACGVLDLSGCSATAGDVRACARATRADLCAAADAPPEACAPLLADGCAPSLTASPVYLRCPDPTASDLPPFEGVYEIVRHTENPASCDIEGGSVLEADAEQMLIFVGTEVFDTVYGTVERCPDLAECRESIARLRALSTDAVPYVGESEFPALGCLEETPGTLRGESQTFYPDPGVCRAVFTETTLTRFDDRSLLVEVRTRDFSGDSDCRVPSSPPASASCALDVYEARFLSGL